MGRRLALVSAALVALVFVIRLATWPLVAEDTDLWYHLAAGRWIAAHGALPHDSFFSYVEPPRPQLAYSWLFQLTVHAVHAAAGFGGLVLLRAVLFAGTAALLIAGLFLPPRTAGRAPSPFLLAALSGLMLVVLTARFRVLRPYDVDLLLLAAMTLVLDSAARSAAVTGRGLSRATWAVVPLVVVGVNAHGVAWPVFLLVLGAHLADALHARDLRRVAPLGVSVVALLATPFGVRLLPIAFTDTTFAAQYIDELRPITRSHLGRFLLDDLAIAEVSAFNLLLVAAAAGAIRLAARWRAGPLVPWLLLAGGIVLLSRGVRFIQEWLVLVVPLLREGLALRGGSRLPSRTVPALLLAAGVGVPIATLVELFPHRPRFPLAAAQLPAGTSAFLRAAAPTGGTILNHGNHGGYLEWALGERWRIRGDLQAPFLFRDADVFEWTHAFHDASVLASSVARDHPDFLLVPRAALRFPEVARRLPRFVPVAFDDVAVLYVDSERRPDVAARRLAAIDPFALALRPGADVEAARREVAGLLEIAPDVVEANLLRARLELAAGDPTSAARAARAGVLAGPERADARAALADALDAAGDGAGAVSAYRAAVERAADPESRARIQIRLGRCLGGQGRVREAFRELRRAVRPFEPRTGFDDLFLLAAAALELGDPRASAYADFALAKAPEEDPRAEWLRERTGLGAAGR